MRRVSVSALSWNTWWWSGAWVGLSCALSEREPSPALASWVSLNYPGGDFPGTEREIEERTLAVWE